MKHVKTGALIALAAGGLFVIGCEKKDDKPEEKQPAAQPDKPKPEEAAKPEASKPAPEPEKVSMVDCGGVNACKGQGTCKTEKHGCGGQNACKGQGVLEMSEAECNEKGGTVTARK